jgi:hypothetical protein
MSYLKVISSGDFQTPTANPAKITAPSAVDSFIEGFSERKKMKGEKEEKINLF